MSNENSVPLENGHIIAFEEYGDTTGVPVIFCHGWPSSHTMARLTDEAARDLGIRIISPDRPGISRSSLQPDRKLIDWPYVVERLVNHLDLGEFRALAVSGGAPYACGPASGVRAAAWSRCACLFDWGTEAQTALSQFIWRQKSPADCPIARRVSSTAQVIIRCLSGTCTKFSRT